MNYYEHHLGDYAEATGHLSFVEDAAYSRLMRKVYATEAALPADVGATQRLVGARTREERAAVQAVLTEFFDLCDDGWHNARCDAEIARFQDKQRKAKASAAASWESRRAKPTHSERIANASDEPDANAMRTHSEGNAPRARSSPQSPVSSLQTPEKEIPARASRKTGLPPGFAVSARVKAWALEKGHRNLDAQLEALVSYAKRKGAKYVDWDEAMMTAIRDNWAKVDVTAQDRFAGAI